MICEENILVDNRVVLDCDTGHSSITRDRALSIFLSILLQGIIWWGTYDGDTVATRASIPLEGDITTLVDSKTVVLVVDNAKRTEMRF